MSRRIAIVEDEAAIRENYADVLRKQGYEVQTYANRKDAMAAFDMRLPNLAIIDIGLENEIDGGFTLCQALRSMSETLPIIFLTARDNDFDTVSGLRMGADDYLTKPFDLEELQVRIKALLRRSDRAPLGASNQNEILSYGPLTLVPERFEAIWFDSPVRLTHLEFELLHCLLQRHGQTVAPSLILKEVWGYEPDDDIETIRVHVRHLRTKLEPDPRKPRFIKTVYGAGYCLELPTGGQLDDVVSLAREERKQQGDRATA